MRIVGFELFVHKSGWSATRTPTKIIRNRESWKKVEKLRFGQPCPSFCSAQSLWKVLVSSSLVLVAVCWRPGRKDIKPMYGVHTWEYPIFNWMDNNGKSTLTRYLNFKKAATCSHSSGREWPQGAARASGHKGSLEQVPGSHLQPLAAPQVAGSGRKWQSGVRLYTPQNLKKKTVVLQIAFFSNLPCNGRGC